MSAGWNKVSEKEPPHAGRYWVFPFIGCDGAKIVGSSFFIDGEFEDTYPPQHFDYWHAIERPEPPEELYEDWD